MSPGALPPFHVIIVAAGQGTRFGLETPKQYALLAGKAVLRHSIETFLGMPGIQGIHTVIAPEHENLYDLATQGLDIAAPVYGGRERMDSVKNALEALAAFLDEETVVLIHDAARPLVRRDDIKRLLLAVKDRDAATLAASVCDSLRYADREGNAAAYVNRENLHAIQTPQAFRYGLLKKAYAQAPADRHYTDETGPLSDMGITVHLVPGSRNNFKITNREDLILAENILSAKTSTEIRTGQGFDVHAFDDDARNTHTLRLCGVDIPHDRRLKGHSDADVALHALTDALLGAVGAGDIGLLFPPSDPAFRNMDSARFVEKARDLIADKGGKIINVDVTLICEAPKIGPHREKMGVRVAEILDIATNRVNIKATTTEGLGFTGREEGIAAQAIATILMNIES